MSKSMKFAVISLGGLGGMIILAMIVTYFAGIKVDTMNELNLSKDWAIYRIMFYISAILLWPQISRYLTKPRFDVNTLSDESYQRYKDRRDKDIEYLKKQWWKIGIMFIFFEAVMIQQLGL